MSVIKFNRNFSTLFSWDTDDNPTTEQDYQNAVKNWTETEMNIVDSLLWQPTTEYATGNIVKTPSLPSQYVLRCAETGMSGSTEPDYSGAGAGDTVTDGTVEWVIVSLATGNAADVDAGNIGVNAEVDNSEAWASAIGGGAVAEDDVRLVKGDTVYAVTSVMETNIATNTEAIEDNAENIATNTGNIAQNTTDIDIADKRISNIEKLLQGNLYDYQTDSDSKYVKSVPAGAMPYASLDSIGGKTLVWNQLQKNTLSRTSGGVVFTFDSTDGSLTISEETPGATRGSTAYWLPNESQYKYDLFAGHKYYSKTGNTHTGVQWFLQGYAVNSIITYPSTMMGNMYCSVSPSADLSTPVKFYPQVFDLTLMYGSGNEPASVSAFEQEFPAPYYAPNSGSLLSAGVTEVVSKGKNLLPNTLPSNTINATIASGGAINSATNAKVFAIPCEPNTDYMLSQKATPSAWGRVGFANVLPAIGNTIDDKGSMANRLTFSINSGNNHYMIMQFSSEADFISNVNSNEPMIEVGTAKTNYAPYHAPISYPIPAEIRNLEGYGWSAGSVYNYIDYERKVFVKCVVTETFDGTESWSKQGGTGDNPAYYYHKLGALNSCVTGAIVGNTLPTVLSVAQANAQVGMILINTSSRNGSFVYVRPSALSKDTLSGFVAWLTANPMTVNYGMSTPQEIDISAYLTDDNLISVESGGSLTFPNSNGTDYQIHVPSQETYMVDLQEAI